MDKLHEYLGRLNAPIGMYLQRRSIDEASRHSLLAARASRPPSAPVPAQAQISDDVIRIGVLTDMSGLYADIDGAGSVAGGADGGRGLRAAKVDGKQIEVRRRPTTRTSPTSPPAIAREWFDNDRAST